MASWLAGRQLQQRAPVRYTATNRLPPSRFALARARARERGAARRLAGAHKQQQPVRVDCETRNIVQPVCLVSPSLASFLRSLESLQAMADGHIGTRLPKLNESSALTATHIATAPVLTTCWSFAALGNQQVCEKEKEREDLARNAVFALFNVRSLSPACLSHSISCSQSYGAFNSVLIVYALVSLSEKINLLLLLFGCFSLFISACHSRLLYGCRAIRMIQMILIVERWFSPA